MKRQGSAQWHGGIKEGNGSVSTESGVLNHTQYSFKTRFEQDKGTNPEELIAAAHAGCFSMAFAAQLEKEGLKAEKIHTTATVSLEKSTTGFSIPAIHLHVKAKIPNVNAEAFQIAANTAKENCPVSRLFNAEITMETSLEN
ncbi:Peroxiredoxin OsmC [Legionella clemsonensis]|uniref:Peroxiredoxin OsmC n=2 Tax=Legionella clemsonensis TaxID=1867846 RepID=A0A222P422_9GAMM|nr:Peroxiredoxin OsmC [Legionella clemsonensis]